MLTITPPRPAATIARAASRAPKNVPRRLTSSTPSPLVVGELEQRGDGEDARRVDPDVQPAEVGDGVVGDRAHRRGVA